MGRYCFVGYELDILGSNGQVINLTRFRKAHSASFFAEKAENYLKLRAGEYYDILREIAFCESGFDEKAKNPGSSAKGLFQILDGTWRDFDCGGDPLNAENNIDCAIKIISESGAGHWEESQNCWK